MGNLWSTVWQVLRMFLRDFVKSARLVSLRLRRALPPSTLETLELVKIIVFRLRYGYRLFRQLIEKEFNA